MIGSPFPSPNSSPEVSPRSSSPSPCRLSIDSERDHQAPDLVYEDHWIGVLEEVATGLHEQKCQVLLGVHAVVTQAIGMTKNFPAELKAECEKAAVELTKASAWTGAQVHAFQSVISKAAHWINSQAQDPDEPNASYGGPLGNVIYQHVMGGHALQEAKACLVVFSAATRDLPFRVRESAASAFVRVLFDAVAQQRQAAAMMSGTKAPERFGARLGAMRTSVDDPVFSWPAWAEKVLGKFSAMLKPEWQRYRLAHSDSTLFEFLVSRGKPSDKRSVAKLFSEKEGAVLTYDLTDGRSGRGTLVPMSQTATTSFFEFEWSATADGDIDIYGLHCIHASAADFDVEEAIVPDFLSALDWSPGLGIVRLQEALASILFKLSHASVFERGQASIVETVLKSIALHHELQLAFGPAWSRPEPQPDQHALSEFKRKQFVADAIADLLLTPV